MEGAAAAAAAGNKNKELQEKDDGTAVWLLHPSGRLFQTDVSEQTSMVGRRTTYVRRRFCALSRQAPEQKLFSRLRSHVFPVGFHVAHMPLSSVCRLPVLAVHLRQAISSSGLFSSGERAVTKLSERVVSQASTQWLSVRGGRHERRDNYRRRFMPR